MADVFLSYTHSDQKIAELVAHRLAESGWATWWDRELLAGERYRTETQHQLDDARCVLVLWSKAALTSRWVLDEADAGANNGRLVQILLEELELPLGFRNVQHVVMSAQDLSGDLFQRLAAAITKKVTPTGADHFAPARIKTITELREALNTLALHASQDELPKSREQVQRLETEFAAKWADIGSVNEAFGRAWASAGDISRAAGYYAAALDAPDSSASFAAAEQLANMRIRLAFADVPAGEAKARQSIHEAIALLNRMSAVRTGHVAEALTANAYKRLAILEAGIGNAAQEAKALAAMEKHFAAAEQIGLVQNLPGLYYTTLNKMSASLAQPRRGTSRRQLEAEDISRARKEIEAINRDKPDFWSLVSSIELTVYEAVNAGALSKRASTIVAAYHDLKRLTESRGMWKSVYDSASFVLSRYAGRATPAERRATEIVLAALKGAAEPA
jgi:hypothetical protein